MCYQTFYSEEEEPSLLTGQEDCLVMNILVPLIASESNPVPVIVYIHSGAFSGGSANMGRLHYVAKRDVIVISFNYRVGALGFACLRTEEIPGNAGLKDQLAALKWINKNIKKFGGDPNRVTLAGFSVGAAMAEILALSKQTDGLINKLILESGTALAPIAIATDPINTAKNIAESLGFKNKGKIQELNEFYINAPIKDLVIKSINFFLTNSTFGFAPCIESTVMNPQPLLTESPVDILKKNEFKKIPILTGFSDMEGLSRVNKFQEWVEIMNVNFEKFLPADLVFDNDSDREKAVRKIKYYYFKDQEVTQNSKQEYVNYFSDVMFKYPITRSAKFYAKSKAPVYFYEFSYVGELNAKHYFMGIIKGASHRDQTAYIWDFFDFTNALSDMDTRDRMTYMWTDFATFGDPTAFESSILKVKWIKYTDEDENYMSIGNELEMKKNPMADNYKLWSDIYDKYYWNPTSTKA
ncbi:hypothetical protein ACJJTC_013519 [Scirpophaga incertulas]